MRPLITMISVQNVTRKFGKNIAVDNISFAVNRGEMLGLLGPNGAGKTTIMRMITGFIPPSYGSITIDGMDIFEHQYSIKKRIGYMPEQPPLYYDMTSRECLTFVAEIQGLRGKEIRDSIEEVSELCGITHVLKRLTGNLSKGFRQRVGLAQALVHKPEILVLDEPTAGLDPKQIIEIRQLIKGLGEDRTVILSSHILPEVRNTCRKIAIINNGRLIAVDTIEALSDMLSRSRRIAVRVARPERVNVDRLFSIKGVNDLFMGEGNEFALDITGSDEIFEVISSAVVEMGAGLLEMKEKGMTLEDIFIQVISGERTA